MLTHLILKNHETVRYCLKARPYGMLPLSFIFVERCSLFLNFSDGNLKRPMQNPVMPLYPHHQMCNPLSHSGDEYLKRIANSPLNVNISFAEFIFSRGQIIGIECAGYVRHSVGNLIVKLEWLLLECAYDGGVVDQKIMIDPDTDKIKRASLNGYPFLLPQRHRILTHKRTEKRRQYGFAQRTLRFFDGYNFADGNVNVTIHRNQIRHHNANWHFFACFIFRDAALFHQRLELIRQFWIECKRHLMPCHFWA